MVKSTDVYVIGILTAYEDRTEIKYVTNKDSRRKIAEWQAGEQAMEFSKEYAKGIALGLCVNGYVAIPMLKADYLNLKNPKTKSKEE